MICEGGWVDRAMSMGRMGLFDLVARMYKQWRADVQGTLPNDLKDKGVIYHINNSLDNDSSYV